MTESPLNVNDLTTGFYMYFYMVVIMYIKQSDVSNTLSELHFPGSSLVKCMYYARSGLTTGQQDQI